MTPVVGGPMRFRPCIDLHAGQVKQIVGESLNADGHAKTTNFVAHQPAEYFAELYCQDELTGGHVIMLGPGNEDSARRALSAFPGGMHVGGGMRPDNAAAFLEAGASHVIVTSYVFRDGKIDMDRIQEMVRAVGRHRLVLDLSCKKRDGQYWVCTDRWQKWTECKVNRENIAKLADFCDEILVHAVDVEGKRSGIDGDLVEILSEASNIIPVTYAGGVRSLADLEFAKERGQGKVDVTVGSALDIFGGTLKYSDLVQWQRVQNSRANC